MVTTNGGQLSMVYDIYEADGVHCPLVHGKSSLFFNQCC